MTNDRSLEQSGAMLLAARLCRKQTIAEHRCYAWLARLRSASELVRTVCTDGGIVRLSLPAAEAC